jgi:hypothetical protein
MAFTGRRRSEAEKKAAFKAAVARMRKDMGVTACCGAHSTYADETLVCKKCFKPVAIGEGDGNR